MQTPHCQFQTQRTLRQVIRTIRVLGILTTFAAGMVRHTSVAAEVSIDEIKSQWKEHEDKRPSLRLEWRESRFYRKGAFSDGGSPYFDANVPEPPEDTVVVFFRSLLCDRERIRFVDDGKYLGQTAAGKRDYLNAEITRVWNRSESRMLRSVEGTFGTGLISTAVQDAYQDAQFRPPVIACWPLSAPNGLRLESHRVAKRVVLDSVECLVLEKLRRSMVDDAELWLQGKPPFLPIRIIGYTRAQRSSELTIEYAHVAGEGWHPSGWKRTWFTENGGYAMAADATVRSHDFAPAVRDSDFTIDFPSGTWVRDTSQPGKPIEYIVREDGSKRIILKDELRRGARYQDLIETETGKAKPRSHPPTPPSVRRWAVLFSSVAVIVSAFFFVVRRHSRV